MSDTDNIKERAVAYYVISPSSKAGERAIKTESLGRPSIVFSPAQYKIYVL